jgi:hypothetical protein
VEPDFAPSGLLAAASNSKNGTALKYHEPPEARAPKRKWRCYVYKGKEELGACGMRCGSAVELVEGADDEQRAWKR